MASEMGHRGPDDSGVWCGEGIGLAHRRLALLDLTQGAHQPTVSEDGRYSMVYNGEVYNYLEMRKELEHEGIRFHTTSDTEVVFKALRRWGVDDAVRRFNGMFALAFWDSWTLTLVLARDRYGTKPLYYALDDDRLTFASEIRPLLATPWLQDKLDHDALLEYLTFQNIISDRTMYSGITLLPPATVLTVSAASGAWERTTYWDFRFAADRSHQDQTELLIELEHLLGLSVERQLRADVEVGAYLSGGIDSGLIASLASERTSLSTFTVGFAGADYPESTGPHATSDERRAARLVASRIGSRHYETVVDPGQLPGLVGAVGRSLEEPRLGQSYPNYVAARLASQHVKAVLAGTGGDELFGGYPWRYLDADASPQPGRMRPTHEILSKYFAQWHRLLDPPDLSASIGPLLSGVDTDRPRRLFSEIVTASGQDLHSLDGALNASLYFEAKTFLHGLLVVEDKLGMAHSLEARFPFLDNDVVDLALLLPASSKVVSDGLLRRDQSNDSRGSLPDIGKACLRRLAGRRLGAATARAPKRGFAAPDAQWFRLQNWEFVESVILNDHSPLLEVVDRQAIHRTLNEHRCGIKNHRLLIWSLLSLDAHLRHRSRGVGLP